MLKNDKASSFLLTHSSKNRVYIKRIEVPGMSLQLGILGIFFLLGLTAMGVGASGLLRKADLQGMEINAALVTPVSAAPAAAALETIDYSRPAAGTDYSANSGGPEADELDGEQNEVEEQLRAVRVRTDPANLPSMWAHLGKINNEFGFRRNPFGGRAYEFHSGMDIDGERGQPVVAPGNGTVVWAGYKGGYGNMIDVDHGNGLITRYGHMSKLEAQVGQNVTRGQLIGYIGSTGRSTGPHLHFELRLNDRPINPRHFLPPEPADLSKLVKR